ncbi:hypothetical protein M1403_03040 [Patescibacteria group bacterium]|nr:hypothetical protein [Patescibacteria group bacterium]
MALRAEHFRSRLITHEFKQNGEGLCWVALEEARLHSVEYHNGNRQQLRQKLIKEMKTTVAGGTDNDDVVAYLEKIGIRHHIEWDCPFERLVAMVEKLPVHVDIFASVWDRRISPGFDETTDPPESHTVAVIKTPLIYKDRRVLFYDPSTYIGGLLDWSREKWEKWWDDGPESGLEADNYGNSVPFDRRWLMLTDISPREVDEYLAS